MDQSDTGLYGLLENLLKEADKPLTCVDLFDVQDVRELAASANRVSDYLGGLWRKGKVTRNPAIRTTNDSSRWAYSWRQSHQRELNAAAQDLHEGRVFNSHKTLLDKPNILITQTHDSVTIELPGFVVTVKTK